MPSYRANRFLVGSAAMVALALASCGPKSNNTGTVVRDGFECQDRLMQFTHIGGFSGESIDVAITCEGDRPIVRKSITPESGAPRTSSKPMGSAAYDQLWFRVEGTGWRHLGDCETIPMDDKEEQYRIEVRHHDIHQKIVCAGRELPFPYDRLVDELRQAAAYIEP